MTTIPGHIPQHSNQFRYLHDPISEALTLLASVMITTIVVVEAISYWGFGSEPGWIALAIAAIVGVAVTYLLAPPYT
jgi:NhaP-type Na+/H+ or K+/H+ antiporter